jgi:hypothetical protein
MFYRCHFRLICNSIKLKLLSMLNHSIRQPKFMHIKTRSLVSAVTVFVQCFLFVQYFSMKQSVAQTNSQNPNFKSTPWTVVNNSLAELLDGGWKVVAQSTFRVAMPRTGGIGFIDDTSFVYTVSKNGKYITCILTNPTPNNGNGGCRLLN